jgi:hypothetical protein
MAKQRKSAHAELYQLRQQAACERMKARDLEAAVEAAKAKVDEASRAVADAYALEDDKLAAQRRKELQDAEAEVIDLGHRVAAAGLRVQRAQQQLDEFAHEHARDLLAEREPNARTVAAELTASVHETLRLAKAYVAERQAQDQLVAAVPGATPRADGPTSTHPWGSQLKDLERAVAEVPECPPPLPRWRGLDQRTQQDHIGRREKLRRKRKLTSEEEQELNTINRELGASAPSVEVA